MPIAADFLALKLATRRLDSVDNDLSVDPLSSRSEETMSWDVAASSVRLERTQTMFVSLLCFLRLTIGQHVLTSRLKLGGPTAHREGGTDGAKDQQMAFIVALLEIWRCTSSRG